MHCAAHRTVAVFYRPPEEDTNINCSVCEHGYGWIQKEQREVHRAVLLLRMYQWFQMFFFFQLNPLTPLYFSTSLQVFSSICLFALQSRGWSCQTSLSNLIFQFQCGLPCTTKRWLEIQQFNLVDKSNVFYESPKAIN